MDPVSIQEETKYAIIQMRMFQFVFVVVVVVVSAAGAVGDVAA